MTFLAHDIQSLGEIFSSETLSKLLFLRSIWPMPVSLFHRLYNDITLNRKTSVIVDTSESFLGRGYKKKTILVLWFGWHINIHLERSRGAGRGRAAVSSQIEQQNKIS